MARRSPRSLALFVAALAGVAPGCLSPGGLDMDPVNLYQRRLAARGPQGRSGAAPGGLLEPLRGAAPPLAVMEDPNGPVVRLLLKDAILRALAQNTDIRVVSFDPAVSREETIKAAAAFDAVVFAGWEYAATDERAVNTSIFSLDPFADSRSKSRLFQAGVKELATTGGTWSVAYAMTRMWDNSSFANVRRTYEPTVVLEVAQPLLRDAWPEFNMARVRLARTNEKVSQAKFRETVEGVVSRVIQEYWNLWLARREVPIWEEHLKNGQEVLRTLKLRAEIDAAAAELRQAEAAVASRQIIVHRAYKAAADARDALVRLLADPQLNLRSRLDIETASLPTDSNVVLDEAGELATALEHNPVLEQARLAVALGEIHVAVARNQALPRLDLKASAQYQGLSASRHQAHEDLGTLDYLDYTLGLSFEYPLGNRERLAELRKQRLSRLRAVSQLQGVADEVAQTVRERMREIARVHREIELQRAAVEAYRLQLQAIQDLEKNRAKLSPEFLNLKLQVQESLANARVNELKAVVGYNVALADLARTTGTILKQHGVDLLLPAAAGEAPWPPVAEPPAAQTAPGGEPPGRQSP